MTKFWIVVVGLLCCVPLGAGILRRFPALLGPAITAYVVMLGMRRTWYSVMLGSEEWYRGHTEGFLVSGASVGALILFLGALREFPGKKSWLLVFGYLGFVGLAGISLWGAFDLRLAAMALFKFTSFLFVLLAGMFVLKEKRLPWLWAGLVLVLFLEVAWAGSEKLLPPFLYRATAGLESPKTLRMFCYIAALPLLSLALCPSLKDRWVLLLSAAAGCAGVAALLALSRASIALFAIGAAVVVVASLLRGDGQRSGLIFKAGIAVVILGCLLGWRPVLQRFQNQTEGLDSVRDVYNTMAKMMLVDHPMGVGWNNYGLVNSRPYPKYSVIIEDWYEREQRLMMQEGDPEPVIDERFFRRNSLPESVWWVYLAETGYLGFLGVVSFLFLALRAIWGAVRRSLGTSREHFYFGVLVAVSCAIAHSFLERTLMTETPVMCLFLLLVGGAVRQAACGVPSTDPEVLARRNQSRRAILAETLDLRSLGFRSHSPIFWRRGKVVRRRVGK